MSEQPKDDGRKAKMVPGPWRWGWWRLDDKNEVEFRPLDEIDEINPISGIFHHRGSHSCPTFPNIELSSRPYGFRFKPFVQPLSKASADWDLKDDGFIDESHPYGVVGAMGCTASDGSRSVTVLATKPVRDLIEAAPNLLAMCERLADALENPGLCAALLEAAHVLIAKARGEAEKKNPRDVGCENMRKAGAAAYKVVDDARKAALREFGRGR